MIALLVITDGRLEYLRQTITSLNLRLLGDIGAVILVDDSGNPEHAAAVEAEWPHWQHIHNPQRLGFSATIRVGWQAAMNAGASHVVHVEEDFTLNRIVRVSVLRRMLDDHPTLAQIALKRQPVNPVEEQAGGLMQMWPEGSWHEQDGLTVNTVTFTTNPSLVAAHAITTALATGDPLTEPNLTRILLENGYTFGYLGGYDDPPVVTHIGDNRSGGWLL